MANDHVFNEGDKKKIKVVQPKAADPGFGFFLETEDGTPFDSKLNITINIKDDTLTYTTTINVTNCVCESKLPIIAPFGDNNWLNPSIEMQDIVFEVKVEFVDAPSPNTEMVCGRVPLKQGVFEISITPIAGPQRAFFHIFKGLKILLGLDRA